MFEMDHSVNTKEKEPVTEMEGWGSYLKNIIYDSLLITHWKSNGIVYSTQQWK